MKLNVIEFAMMNNPLREYVQTTYELPILQEMVSNKNPYAVLEIGCGSGYGTTLIQKHFNPHSINAVDLDEKMIQKALKRDLQNATFTMMDASKLDFIDDQFDAVFDFGIIHHIPNWKECVLELKRVLKNGGEIILEELSIDTFNTLSGRFFKAILDHPYSEMFTQVEFVEYLETSGFKILNFRESYPFKTFKFFSLNAILSK